MILKQKVIVIVNGLRELPLKITIPVGLTFFLLFCYVLAFLIDRPVHFSYARETCVRQLTFLPGLQRSTDNSGFAIDRKQLFAIGSLQLTSMQTCFTSHKAPQVGITRVSTAPLGGWFARKIFALKVDSPPFVRATILDKPVPTGKALTIPLSSPDTVFDYSLDVDGKTADCPVRHAALYCDIFPLGLIQGKDYGVQLVRSFKGKKIAIVAQESITTLVATSVLKTSVVNNQTVYDTPKSFSVEFDKPVKKAVVTLEKIESDKRTAMKLNLKTNNKLATVTFEDGLNRNTSYELVIDKVEALDGSTLAAPYRVPFLVSGGPKPISVSVGSTGVNQNAQIVVTLDQPIKDTVDITQFARVQGTSGTVVKRSPTELVYSLSGADLCSAFSLLFDKGVESASNNEVSVAWKFDARTICGTSSVIGYSVKGRPITAYYFGNGATTVLFTGGMHGSEPSGYTTMQAWVDYLMTYGYKIPSDKRVVIVPNTNPDGISSGSRNNANNVNIDRNFATANWKADIETNNGVLVNGGGTSAASEPETAAVAALTRQLVPRLEVSFHSQGRLVGANKYGDSVAIGAVYASTVGYATMFYDAEAVMGYPMTGEYEDWMGESMGIPAILVELPSSSGNYLNAQLNALMKMLSV